MKSKKFLQSEIFLFLHVENNLGIIKINIKNNLKIIERIEEWI